jgi:hypothetical protein
MGDARILSLDEFRKRKTDGPSTYQEFDVLFRNARELRGVGQELVSGEIAIMTWGGMRDWFQREIAAEVFRRHLFQRCALLSIGFVSDLLASFARDCREHVDIAEHLGEYTTGENPNEVLEAANIAFLMFTLWPERRARRSVHYRQLALGYGPSLYATYAGLARKDFGYCMAEAFEPLGDIARERFGRT